MSRLELSLFGPPSVSLDQDAYRPAPMAALLLAFVALHGPVSRERVMGFLWPESSQKKAQGSLRYLLHSLKTKAKGLLEIQKSTLDLAQGVHSDLRTALNAESERELAQLAEITPAPFCEGVSATDPELEDWMLGQRQRLGEAIKGKLLDLSRRLPPREALLAARRATDWTPDCQECLRRVLELLGQLGKTAESHQVYENFRERLWTEMGTEPEPELKSLLLAPRQFPLGNLPGKRRELIGRHEEKEQWLLDLRKTRLLTLTGEGGMGKTSSALDLARQSPNSKDAVFMDLVPYDSKVDLPTELLKLLNFNLQQSLAEQLENRELLLILDNCEHIIDAAATFAAKLLDQCSGVTIIATSRESLRIQGEKVRTLNPLADRSAIQLFQDRAKQAGHADPLDEELVREICSKLDGLPLAIELAAARTRSLSLGEIKDALSDRLSFLRNRNRDAAERQQTLRALIDWSYSRLSENEQEHFRRLAIFKSGFDARGAQSVLQSQTWQVSEGVQDLVDRSLLRSRATGDGLRFTMLESLREFGLWELQQRQECVQTAERHLEYCLELSEALESPLLDHKLNRELNRLEGELAEFRGALEFAYSHRPEAALRLAVQLGPLWKDGNHRSEGRKYLETALKSATAAQALWPWAQLTLGEILIQLALCQEAKSALEKCYTQAIRSGDQNLIPRACKGLGSANVFLGNLEVAHKWYLEALQGYSLLGDHHEIANCTNNQGMVAIYQRDFDLAYSLFHEALELYTKLEDCKGRGIALGNLGFVENSRGNSEAAIALLRRSLDLLGSLGALWNIAYFLEALGQALWGSGRPSEATEALSVAQSLRDQLGTPRLDSELDTYEECLKALKSELGASFASCWDEASELSYGEVLEALR